MDFVIFFGRYFDIYVSVRIPPSPPGLSALFCFSCFFKNFAKYRFYVLSTKLDSLMGKEGYNCTDFLFTRSSFKIGLGSVFNIAGNYFIFNSSQTEQEADCKAIKCDWEMVGKDMKDVMEEYRKALKSHLANEQLITK